VSENVDLAAANVPRSLKRVAALLSSAGWRRTASIHVPMVVIGQEVLVLEDAAARHGVSARPRNEQDAFEEGILFGVLLDSGALKAIDGRDVDVVENQLLRVASRQSVVWLEEKDRW
jgi:hypothetical protein